MTDTIMQFVQDWGICIVAVAVALKMLSGTIRRFRKLF